jgi:hypothetical protein
MWIAFNVNVFSSHPKIPSMCSLKICVEVDSDRVILLHASDHHEFNVRPRVQVHIFRLQ